MKFSVIIPSRTINDHIKENVSHLKKVKYYDFEVIIVLDEMIKVNFGPKEDRFKVLAAGPVSPGEKRNLAAQSATGDVLAFLDDDAFPDVYWLRKAANIFEEMPDLYALGGPAITPDQVSFEEKMTGRVLESYLTGAMTADRHKPGKRKEIDDYPTVNLFVRKDAFDSIGGFDLNFWPGEDTKLCLDLVNKYKKNFLYDPEPLVHHHRRELFKPYLEQISRYGFHRGWFARKFPKNSRKVAFFVPTMFVLGLTVGLPVSLLISKLWWVYLLIVFLYFTMVFAEAQRVSMSDRDFKAFKYVFFGIFLTHWHYGWNFLKGLFSKPKLKLRAVDEATGNYQGG